MHTRFLAFSGWPPFCRPLRRRTAQDGAGPGRRPPGAAAGPAAGARHPRVAGAPAAPASVRARRRAERRTPASLADAAGTAPHPTPQPAPAAAAPAPAGPAPGTARASAARRDRRRSSGSSSCSSRPRATCRSSTRRRTSITSRRRPAARRRRVGAVQGRDGARGLQAPVGHELPRQPVDRGRRTSRTTNGVIGKHVIYRWRSGSG